MSYVHENPDCDFQDSVVSNNQNDISNNQYALRMIQIEMGNRKGDGMDGGYWGVQAFGGGKFAMEISQDENCKTGYLNTEDNNWEVGEVNYFVGRQMESCENFKILHNKELKVRIKHSGPDGGRIFKVTLYGSNRFFETHHTCLINKKLDDQESHEVKCKL